MSSQEHWPLRLQQTRGPSRPAVDGSSSGRKDVFDGLASRRRRRILAILLDGTDPVDVPELARRLAAVEEGRLPTTVSEAATESLLVDLRHVHLPILADVGLLDWDEVDRTVVAADHPAFDDPAFRNLVETGADVGDVVDCLASEHRRLVVAILQEHDGSMSCSDLAREVAAFQDDARGRTAEEVEISLHHTHLPKLADVGLVERDREAGTVAYRSHPEVDESWFALDPVA